MLARLTRFRAAAEPIVRQRLRDARAWGLKIWRVPAKRERIKAFTTFAFIFAFAAGSLDYLITGGPDWNPDGGQAYASEYVAPRIARAAFVEAAVIAPPPALPEAEVLDADYRYTSETLLGGPETVLASFEPFADNFTSAADKAFFEISTPLY